MLSQVKDWERITYELLFTNEDWTENGYGFSSVDKERIFHGPVGWAGSSLDSFAFDMFDIGVDTNPEKIIESIKSYIERNVEDYEDLLENGLYVERYCGWKQFDNLLQ